MSEHAEETWRAVLGFEGWYEASSEGRVRSIRRPLNGGPRCHEPYPIVLTPLRHKKGYVKYCLGTCNGTRRRRRIFAHRIIYEAFHGAIPPGLTVNHIDGVKMNNRPGNLEIATNLEQNQHARRSNLLRWKTASGFTKPRLTPDDVREIRRLIAAHEMTMDAIAARYGIVAGTIGHILAGRSWKYVV